MKLNLDRTPLAPPTKKDDPWGSPVGWWVVTTEGDEEGRSTKNFGRFYGHVAEIAFSLPENACYSYSFRAIDGEVMEVPPVYQMRRTSATVSFTRSKNFTASSLCEWFDCPEVKVKASNYFQSFEINLWQEKDQQEAAKKAIEVLRAKALAKLTPAEKKALGF